MSEDLLLFADPDCEKTSFNVKEVAEDLLISMEDLLELSCDCGCERMEEVLESLFKAVGILCVSMAAGGGLFKRLATLVDAIFCLSSSFLSLLSSSFFSFSNFFFSFFRLFPPKSDQLGD